jgi:hypothetical protein
MSLRVAAALLAVLSVQVAHARVIELRHDTLEDYQSATAVCGFAVGERFAVQFTPPDYPARLLTVRVLLVNMGLSLMPPCQQVSASTEIEMPLEIYHMISSAPGTSMGYFDEYFYSNDTVLNEVNLAGSNLIIQDGSFLVAFTLSSQNASPAHDGSNLAKKGMNFIYGDIGLGTQWYSFADLSAFGADPKGDWVMRIDVEVPDQPQDGGVDAGGDIGGDTGGDTGSGDTGADAGSGDDSVPGEDRSAGCVRDADCAGGQVCDTDSGVCVQVSCTGDADCVGGYLCRDNVCRKLCTGDGDCKGGESCTSSSGVKLCLPIEEESSCGCHGFYGPGSSRGSNSNGTTTGLIMVGILALLVRRRRSSGGSRT